MIHPRKDRTTTVATLLVVVIVLALLLCIALVSLTYHQLVLDGRWTWASDWLRNADAPTRSSALGQLGDYFGGTLNPILSLTDPWTALMHYVSDKIAPTLGPFRPPDALPATG